MIPKQTMQLLLPVLVGTDRLLGLRAEVHIHGLENNAWHHTQDPVMVVSLGQAANSGLRLSTCAPISMPQTI